LQAATLKTTSISHRGFNPQGWLVGWLSHDRLFVCLCRV
jgi:hypothetical protein